VDDLPVPMSRKITLIDFVYFIQPQISTTTKEAGSSVVSSTVDQTMEIKRSKVKKEIDGSS
jgi:hypothetical protein